MPVDLKANLISEKIIRVVKKFMIFENIGSHDIKRILNPNPDSDSGNYHRRVAKLCQYDKDETVIQEGSFDSWSFWVVKGEYEVTQKGVCLARIGTPGEIFGEMSVFEGIPRTASVISKTGGICLCIDMSIIDNLNDKKIENIIKEGFYSVILKRLGNTKGKIETAIKKLDLKYASLLDFENRIKDKVKENTRKKDA